VEVTTANGRPGAWIWALGLVICLMGCQPRVYRTPPLRPPRPPAASLPQPARPIFYVAINQLNLRGCPGLECPKITALELNAAVENLGEIDNWTQVRVKSDGTIGFVNSRYLSPQPVEVAQPAKKKSKKAGVLKSTQPPEAPGGQKESGPKPPLPTLPEPGEPKGIQIM
jgi:Bacterial SH3 domain